MNDKDISRIFKTISADSEKFKSVITTEDIKEDILRTILPDVVSGEDMEKIIDMSKEEDPEQRKLNRIEIRNFTSKLNVDLTLALINPRKFAIEVLTIQKDTEAVETQLNIRDAIKKDLSTPAA